MNNTQVEMGEKIGRITSEKSQLAHPIRYEYDFESSDSVIEKEKKLILSAVNEVICDTHFGHFFDGERKNISNYFSKLVKQLPRELVSALSQFSARDQESVVDMYGVAPVAYRLGRARGLRGIELDDLSIGVAIHDFGKDGILNIETLHKDGFLTKEEWKNIHLHPTIGAEIIDKINAYSLKTQGKYVLSKGIRQTELEHHVYYDSDEGYPNLNGAKPCRKAQIAKVADSLHTLRLRNGIPLREGLVGIIHRTQRGEYNPHVVRTLIQLIRKDKSDPRKTGIGETKTLIPQERRSYDA